MKNDIIRQSLLLALIIFVIVGIILSYRQFTVSGSTKQCKLDLTQECTVKLLGEEVSVQFLRNVELEEEIPIEIQTSKNIEITQMWVQGVNMFMGKSPVFIDAIYSQSNATVHNGHIFLGACSEPKMKWQLVIKTKSLEQQEQTWFFNFNTDRNKKS